MFARWQVGAMGLAFAGLLALSSLHAQEQGKPVSGNISFGLQEQAEVWSNLRGGRNRGAIANGLLTGTVNADLGGLVGLDGWYLYGSLFQIHGRSVGNDLVGDLQTVSNIDATRATKLYNLWITRDFLDGRLNLRLGQQGANDEMMISPQAQLFLNSSFGYPALLAANLPSGGPNYPIAAPMVRWVYQISDAVSWAGAVFNGDPAGPGTNDPQIRNRHGIAFRLRDAPLIFNELWLRPEALSKGLLPGIWKIGAWYHDGNFADQRFDAAGNKIAQSGLPGRRMKGNHGLYVLADQLVWPLSGTDDQGLGLWAFAMVAPADRNLIDFYVEGGLTFKGLVPSRPKDRLGFAFAYMRTSDAARGYYEDRSTPIQGFEMVSELTYQFIHSERLSIQPSLQYVRHPGAAISTWANRFSHVPQKDAVVFGTRATMTW